MGELKEAIKYPISEGEATYSLRQAWFKLYNEYPSNNSLALLYAQWALETGFGKSCWNYNYGNIKRSADEDYCMFRCDEIINGKAVWFDPPSKVTWFRAYPNALAGAYDYIKFLSQRKRYEKAWQSVINGDPADFAHQLKIAGYYTASESIYLRGVVSLTNQFKNKANVLLSWKPSPEEEAGSRSLLPTIVPGEIPITIPEPVDLDYHPDQENPKNIEIPANGIIEIIIRMIETILNKKD